MRSLLTALLLGTTFLASCAPTKTAAGSSTPKLTGISAPLLKSSFFESKWGAPSVEVNPDGTYGLRYIDPQHSLNFMYISSLSSAGPAPATAPAWQEEYMNKRDELDVRENQQSYRTATIAGQSVKWYQQDGGSGADYPAWRTVDFTLSSPDGKTGHYRIIVCAASEREAADWIQRVNF